MQSLLQLALIEEVRDPSRRSGSARSSTSRARRAGRRGAAGARGGGRGRGPARGAGGGGARTAACSSRGRTDGTWSPPPEGAYQETPLFQTDPDQVFWALQGRRLPAKRHPYGIQLRIAELIGDRITDESGDLWHRRIEEIDALACALCAHRFAVGHASWMNGVVLPGTSLPRRVLDPRRDAAGRAAQPAWIVSLRPVSRSRGR